MSLVEEVVFSITILLRGCIIQTIKDLTQWQDYMEQALYTYISFHFDFKSIYSRNTANGQ